MREVKDALVEVGGAPFSGAVAPIDVIGAPFSGAVGPAGETDAEPKVHAPPSEIGRRLSSVSPRLREENAPSIATGVRLGRVIARPHAEERHAATSPRRPKSGGVSCSCNSTPADTMSWSMVNDRAAPTRAAWRRGDLRSERRPASTQRAPASVAAGTLEVGGSGAAGSSYSGGGRFGRPLGPPHAQSAAVANANGRSRAAKPSRFMTRPSIACFFAGCA